LKEATSLSGARSVPSSWRPCGCGRSRRAGCGALRLRASPRCARWALRSARN